MEKNVGILTFHASHNCGSMMQTYALQTVIERMGADCKIIDFSNYGQRELYALKRKCKSVKDFLKAVLFYIHRKRLQRNYESYENFKHRMFHLTAEEYVEMEQLDDQDYDLIITGSDQVWNVAIADSDDAYFLPWVKEARKGAYAPSFGAKNPEKYASNPEKYGDYLRTFEYLSVREENGRKWIKNLTGKDVPVLLDPTLLLQAADYERIAMHELHVPEKYIFYYAPGHSRQINKLVRQISKRYQMPVIAFNARSFVTKGMFFYGFRLPNIESPDAYLKLIANASLVITTSFHGTIFSTIFRKSFWTIKNGGMFGDDDRVHTLVNQLGIQERVIPIEYDPQKDYFEQPNYGVYEDRIKPLQNKAYQYLREILDSL